MLTGAKITVIETEEIGLKVRRIFKIHLIYNASFKRLPNYEKLHYMIDNFISRKDDKKAVASDVSASAEVKKRY